MELELENCIDMERIFVTCLLIAVLDALLIITVRQNMLTNFECGVMQMLVHCMVVWFIPFYS